MDADWVVTVEEAWKIETSAILWAHLTAWSSYSYGAHERSHGRAIPRSSQILYARNFLMIRCRGIAENVPLAGFL